MNIDALSVHQHTLPSGITLVVAAWEMTTTTLRLDFALAAHRTDGRDVAQGDIRAEARIERGRVTWVSIQAEGWPVGGEPQAALSVDDVVTAAKSALGALGVTE